MEKPKNYRICKRCIMDTTDPYIHFDSNGLCKHCTRQLKIITSYKEGSEKLTPLIDKIKKSSKTGSYDCIIGVSGGVDSTYVAYIAKQLGLHPLAVHFDNGWNSELAIMNIESMLAHLDIDLYTHVINWNEFKDLQLAFLKSSVYFCEVPSDHAIMALLYNIANKEGIKFILSGSNAITEGILPNIGFQAVMDWRFIKSIHRKHGSSKLNNYPHLNFIKWIYFLFVKKIKIIPILNYMDYNKNNVENTLKKELDWKSYGVKHHESIYTKFYQSYFTKVKFGMDNRRGHLSSLIVSGQITREEALHEIETPPYDKEEMNNLKEFIAKKFRITPIELDQLIDLPKKSHLEYSNSIFFFKILNMIKIVKDSFKISKFR